MICYDAVVALETRISAQEDVRREAADAWEGHLREMQDNAGASRGEAQRAGHKHTRGAIGDEIFASGRTRKASKSPGSQSDAQRDARATDALELDLESASDFCLNFVFVKQIKSGQFHRRRFWRLEDARRAWYRRFFWSARAESLGEYAAVI